MDILQTDILQCVTNLLLEAETRPIVLTFSDIVNSVTTTFPGRYTGPSFDTNTMLGTRVFETALEELFKPAETSWEVDEDLWVHGAPITAERVYSPGEIKYVIYDTSLARLCVRIVEPKFGGPTYSSSSPEGTEP